MSLFAQDGARGSKLLKQHSTVCFEPMQTPLPLLPFASLQRSEEASSQIVYSLDTEMLQKSHLRQNSNQVFSGAFLSFSSCRAPTRHTRNRSSACIEVTCRTGLFARWVYLCVATCQCSASLFAMPELIGLHPPIAGSGVAKLSWPHFLDFFGLSQARAHRDLQEYYLVRSFKPF